MQIHVIRNGESLGPYSVEEVNAYLSAGALAPADLAWYPSVGEDWVPLSAVPGIVAAAATTTTAPSLPPVPPPSSTSRPATALPPPLATVAGTTLKYADYGQVPWYRRSGAASLFILFNVLSCGWFPGILIVCILVLTGDVFLKGRDEQGNLLKWGRANKVAALVLLAIYLLLAGAAWWSWSGPSPRPGKTPDPIAQVTPPSTPPVQVDEVSPGSLPSPKRHVNDWANLLKPATVETLDRQLVEHERETSDQVLVAVMGKLPAGVAVEAYTLQLANTWGVGQKGRNNGVVLFVFPQERKIRIQVGTGLTNTLTDARCQQIIKEEIVPPFLAGDADAGTTAGVQAILAALRPVTVQ